MEKREKIQRIVIVSIVCVAIVVISLIAYLRNINNSNGDEISSKEQDLESSFESASTQMGKTIEEADEEYETAEVVANNTNTNTNTNTQVKAGNVTTSKVVENEVANSVSNTIAENNNVEENDNNDKDIEKTTELTFTAPVKGQVLREFATDSLVYSNTLEEWITHNGIDIKADKTSVVTASASGTVYAIKNDPRYGLTVIIDHDNGYRTIYSNLLTAEFVVEGEEVKQGQSIGTVGNSATFEVSDDYHLHFELLKDNEYLDPTIYIEFE